MDDCLGKLAAKILILIEFPIVPKTVERSISEQEQCLIYDWGHQ